MKRIVRLVFCMLFFTSLGVSALETSSLREAMDVAFNSLVTSGKFAAFSNKYGLNSTRPACSNPTTSYPAATGLLKTVLDSGSISLCRMLPFVLPFWNATSNTGFLIDIVDGILDQWKQQYGRRLSISWHYVPFKTGYFIDLQAAVNDGTCHAVADIVTVTSAREKLADFTCPYTTTTSGFLRGTLEAWRTNLTTLEALNDPTIKIGVIAGSVYDSPSSGAPRAQRILFKTDDAALSAVSNQTVHATLFTGPLINLWLLTNPCNGCKYYDDGKEPQEYAMFVKKSAASSLFIGSTSLLVPLILILLLVVHVI